MLRVFDLKRLKLLVSLSVFAFSYLRFEKKDRCVLWVVSVHELTVPGSRQGNVDVRVVSDGFGL